MILLAICILALSALLAWQNREIARLRSMLGKDPDLRIIGAMQEIGSWPPVLDEKAREVLNHLVETGPSHLQTLVHQTIYRDIAIDGDSLQALIAAALVEATPHGWIPTKLGAAAWLSMQPLQSVSFECSICHWKGRQRPLSIPAPRDRCNACKMKLWVSDSHRSIMKSSQSEVVPMKNAIAVALARVAMARRGVLQASRLHDWPHGADKDP